MDESELDFIRSHRSAVMATIRKNGTAHIARMSVGVVDGKILSVGTKTRVRTKHLLQNPHATLAIFDDGPLGQWLGVEARVTLYEGQDAWDKALAFHRVLGDPPKNVDEFYKRMAEEQRIIYEFEPIRTYGRYQ